jgi:phosphate transport system substrate-binding protein
MRRSIYGLFALVLTLSMVLSACATTTSTPSTAPTVMVEQPTSAPTTAIDQPTVAPTAVIEPTVQTTTSIELPIVDPAALSGSIYAAGSSTVYPLEEAIAEQFRSDGYAGELKIDSVGTGGGFERFCKTGETDISNASRKIKDAELENCKLINRTPVEFLVGLDALAIVVSKENDFAKDLTIAQLAQIFSDKATKWSDINPSWPAEEIMRFAPGTDSGTFDYFIESVMAPSYEKDLAKAKEAFLLAANLQTSEDDNVLVQGVEGNKYAIGFFGFAYYPENQDKLNLVSVEGVTPSFDTAENGSYKLSRPLFIYSDAEIMKSKPEVAGFINYFLTYVNDVIGKVGYFPASEEALNASMQTFLDIMK